MDESGLDHIRKMTALPPFHQWLQPNIVEADEATGRVAVSLAVRPEFRRAPDRADVHGGVIAALIDIAGHAAIAAKLRRGVPTIDLRIDYLRLANGSTLLATAEPIRIGRSIGVVDVRITDDRQALVAVGRCVFSTQDR